MGETHQGEHPKIDQDFNEATDVDMWASKGSVENAGGLVNAHSVLVEFSMPHINIFNAHENWNGLCKQECFSKHVM